MTARNAAAIASLVVLLRLALRVHRASTRSRSRRRSSRSWTCTPFQRVLVAGFISGGTDDVDANLETVRLLRSQLRTSRPCASSRPTCCRSRRSRASRPRRRQRADAADTAERRRRRQRARTRPAARHGRRQTAPPRRRRPRSQRRQPQRHRCRRRSKDPHEKDLERYQAIFANTAYWKKLGEEYQNPLIVTGTVLFTPHQTAGFVTQNRESLPTSSGAAASSRVAPTWSARASSSSRSSSSSTAAPARALLRDVPRGNPLQRAAEHARALVLLRADGPAHPEFLNTLSTQKISGTRVLLK